MVFSKNWESLRGSILIIFGVINFYHSAAGKNDQSDSVEICYYDYDQTNSTGRSKLSCCWNSYVAVWVVSVQIAEGQGGPVAVWCHDVVDSQCSCEFYFDPLNEPKFSLNFVLFEIISHINMNF